MSSVKRRHQEHLFPKVVVKVNEEHPLLNRCLAGRKVPLKLPKYGRKVQIQSDGKTVRQGSQIPILVLALPPMTYCVILDTQLALSGLHALISKMRALDIL